MKSRQTTCLYAFGMLVALGGIGLALFPAVRAPPVTHGTGTHTHTRAQSASGGGGWLAGWLESCPYIEEKDGAYSLTFDIPAALNRAVARVQGWYSPHATGLRTYTRTQLRAYDGSDPAKPILLGMNGDVFDVTELGYDFYGKGMAYNVFAGRDATRALSLGSLDAGDIENYRTDDFNERQMKQLRDQHEFYLGKYPRVGRIVDDDTPPPKPPQPSDAQRQ